MDRLQSREQLRQCREGIFYRHLAIFPEIIERAVREIFKDKQVAAARDHMLIERYDMGMKYARGSARFGLKSLEKARILAEIMLNLFDRDQSIEGQVTRLIDYRHAAAAQLFHYQI